MTDATDDPWEILGVPRDADAQALRRAYVERIKVHRPDRDPEAFARIRRAYDEARRRLSWWTPEDDEEVEEEREAEAERASAAQALDTRIAGIWERFVAGEDAATLLLALGEAREDPRIAMHRMLLLDAAGGDWQAEVQASLLAGAEVADWIGSVVRLHELEAVLASPACHWRVLRNQAQPHRSLRLLRIRLQLLLRNGRLDQASDEVLDDVFLRDQERYRWMEMLGLEVLSVAAWAGVPQAERLANHFAPNAVSEDHLFSPTDHHDAALAMAGPYQAWRQAFPHLKSLRRFLVLVPILDQDAYVPVVESLALDVIAAPGRHEQALRWLQDESPDLLDRFTACVEALGWPDDVPAHIPSEGLARLVADLVWSARIEDERAAESHYRDGIRSTAARIILWGGAAPDALAVAAAEQMDGDAGVGHVLSRVRQDALLWALHAARRLAWWRPRIEDEG